jgi:TonB family protein
VEVRYDVTVEGQVINARVVRSDPADLFDAAALEAVRTWRFNAPLVEGERREALNQQSTVTFRVTGADKYDRY